MALKLEREFTETRPDLIIISIFGAFQIFDSNNSIDSRGMDHTVWSMDSMPYGVCVIPNTIIQ